MNIAKFSKSNLDQLRISVNGELEKLSQKYGIKITMGNISFSENKFTSTLTGITLNDATDSTKSMFELKANAELKNVGEIYGLDPSLLNKEVMIGKDKCKFIGLNLRKKKPCLFMLISDPKSFYAHDFQRAKALLK